MFVVFQWDMTPAEIALQRMVTKVKLQSEIFDVQSPPGGLSMKKFLREMLIFLRKIKNKDKKLTSKITASKDKK